MKTVAFAGLFDDHILDLSIVSFAQQGYMPLQVISGIGKFGITSLDDDSSLEMDLLKSRELAEADLICFVIPSEVPSKLHSVPGELGRDLRFIRSLNKLDKTFFTADGRAFLTYDELVQGIADYELKNEGQNESEGRFTPSPADVIKLHEDGDDDWDKTLREVTC